MESLRPGFLIVALGRVETLPETNIMADQPTPPQRYHAPRNKALLRAY